MLLTVTVTGQRKRSVTYHPGGIRGSRLLHARFTEEYMRALFEGAGLVSFTFDQFTSAKWHGRDIDFFLATGTKPAQS